MSPGVLARRGVLLAITGVSLYLLAPALLRGVRRLRQARRVQPALVGRDGRPPDRQLRVHVGGAEDRDARGALGAGDHLPAGLERVRSGGARRRGRVRARCSTRCSPAAACPSAQAASGMTASSVLVFGILLALPLLALPAVLFGAPGRPRPRPRGADRRRGVRAAIRRGRGGDPLGPAAAGGRPGGAVGAQPHPAQARAAERTCRSGCCASATRCARCSGARWWEALLLAAGRWVLDYLTLLAALTAVHANPRPSTVLLAFCAAQFLGTLPLTPGRARLRRGGPDGNARCSPACRPGRGGGDARLPAGVVLAADPRRRRRRRAPPAAVRGGRAASATPAAAEQREGGGHAAADHEAGDRRADQRACCGSPPAGGASRSARPPSSAGR